MSPKHFIFRSPMPASAEAVFDWHCRPGAFERLSPPWESVKVIERTGGVEDGGRVVLAVRFGGLWRRWVAEHCDIEPGRQFCDVQTEGPFAHWRHCHRVIPDGPDKCFLEDNIEFALPFGRVGPFFGGSLVRRKLERMFRYRHRITAGDLSLHQKYSRGHAMKIAVTGSTGLVGSALLPFLTTGGHHVVRIVRAGSLATNDDVVWDANSGQVDGSRLEGLDAVVHLAGENIAARRWNSEQKARIRDSRVRGTKVLCESLAKLARPPRVLVSASAIGFYGSRGDEELDETSASGSGFLTGYMPEEFSAFWRLEPGTGKLLPLDDGPGEQSMPVILATADGKYAMGIVSVTPPGFGPPGYGRWRFVRERVVKWNTVFRIRDASAIATGAYTFQNYVAVGTLEDVRVSLLTVMPR